MLDNSLFIFIFYFTNEANSLCHISLMNVKEKVLREYLNLNSS